MTSGGALGVPERYAARVEYEPMACTIRSSTTAAKPRIVAIKKAFEASQSVAEVAGCRPLTIRRHNALTRWLSLAGGVSRVPTHFG